MTEHIAEETNAPADATVTYLPTARDWAEDVLAGPAANTAVLATAREILADATAPAVPVPVEKVDLDAFDDAPLIPAWVKTPEGWAAWSGVFYRARRRDFRRWVRRQATDKGHVRQFGRGVRRSHDWVVGFEGVRVESAAHTAHVLTREARAANRSARFTPRILGSKKELAMKAAQAATPMTAVSANTVPR